MMRSMRCPECGADCWRNEVDVGVGTISDEWKCTECAWDEDQAFPMRSKNWNEWLADGPKPDDYREAPK